MSLNFWLYWWYIRLLRAAGSPEHHSSACKLGRSETVTFIHKAQKTWGPFRDVLFYVVAPRCLSATNCQSYLAMPNFSRGTARRQKACNSLYTTTSSQDGPSTLTVSWTNAPAIMLAVSATSETNFCSPHTYNDANSSYNLCLEMLIRVWLQFL